MGLTFFIALQIVLVFAKLNGMILWEWVFVFMPWMAFITILVVGNTSNVVKLIFDVGMIRKQLKLMIDKEK